MLADTGRTKRKQVHWLDAGSDELLAALRVLNGYDVDLATDQTRLISRLRDCLTAIAPALERAMGNRLHQAGIRDLLTACPTLTALRAAGPAQIEQTLKQRSPRLAGKVTTAVTTALAAQDLTLPAEAATGRVIAELAGELDRVCARRDALAAEIEEAFLARPFGELLASMPGIGPRTGARILAEIGDRSAFRDGSKLAAYAGLAPVTRQSGTSLAGESRSRRGNHRLKNAMFLPPSPACATPPPRRSTTANAPTANATTPPSSAWPDAAATSSSPCSAPTSPANPPVPPQPWPRQPDRNKPASPITRQGLTKNMGTPPAKDSRASPGPVRQDRSRAVLPRSRHRPLAGPIPAKRESGARTPLATGAPHYVPGHPGSDLPARLMTAIDLRGTPELPAIDLP